VSEYGVHWNFYFTLAGVYLVYSSLRLLGNWAAGPFSAVAIILGAFALSSCTCIAEGFPQGVFVPQLQATRCTSRTTAAKSLSSTPLATRCSGRTAKASSVSQV
jgi:hypothetical protein